MNNKNSCDCNINNSAGSDKSELDCEYTSTGRCDDCALPENDICPHEDEFK